MSSNHENDKSGDVRMELKYCERCGGLWVRERGAGVVYCENCQPKMEDLPVSKKKPGRLILPVQPRTAIEDYETDGEGYDFEAGGGAA